jgi:hypothetical protein
LLALLAGCGGPTVVNVTGTLTRGGKPVPHLQVNFVPESGRPSTGWADENGRYSLQYDLNRGGAVTGTHRVFVLFRPRDVEHALAIEQGLLKPPPDLDAILQKYGPQAKEPLTVEVRAADPVIDLKLD